MYLQADFGSIAQAIEDIRSCHNTLIAEKADLERFLQPLAATWISPSGDSWAQVQNKWNTAADGVYEILWNLYQALDAAHQNYTSTEAALQAVWTT